MKKAWTCLIGIAASGSLLFTSASVEAAGCRTGYCDQDGKVTLSWAASDAADLAGYNVYRYFRSGGNVVETRLNTQLIAPTGCSGGPTEQWITYVDDSGMEEGTAYRYSVTAVDCEGNESSKSSYSPEIFVDLTSPNLNILSPPYGRVDVQDVLVEVAVQDLSCQITLQMNGSKEYVVGSGVFHTTFHLEEGKNVIRVRATDLCDNVTVRSRTVYYMEDPPPVSTVTHVGLAALLLLLLTSGIRSVRGKSGSGETDQGRCKQAGYGG